MIMDRDETCNSKRSLCQDEDRRECSKISPSTLFQSTVENVLDLNNLAVQLLSQGDFATTKATLGMAMKRLEECYAEQAAVDCQQQRSHKRQRTSRAQETEDSSSSSCCTCSQEVETETDKSVLAPVRFVTVADSDEMRLPLDDKELLLHFDRAFEFPVDDDLADQVDFTSSKSKTRLAAILLYNTGLSYHKDGLRNGSSVELKTALRFYKEAYFVLKSAWSGCGFQEVFALLLALLNNMASIHTICYSIQQAEQCVNWMSKAIGSSQCAVLDKHDFTFFSLNISVFQGSPLRYATAA